MKDFEAKRKVAEGTSVILRRMYECVHANSFDENVDFSNIPSTTLKDFWLYTAGFIGFRNNEDLDQMSSNEIQRILAGKFILKFITDKQAEVIANRAGVEIENNDEPQKVALYTIQDGTYYINKNIVAPEQSEPSNFISLETSPVELHTETPQDYVDPKFVLRLLRNTFAHESPYIKGNKLTFLKDDVDDIVISKMWLRGYTELFARQSSTYNSAELYSYLCHQLENSENTLADNDQVNEVIELAKPMLDEQMQEAYFLIKYLTKERLSLEPNYFKRDFHEKLSTLSCVLANNSVMFKKGKGSTNSSLLYGLINLVGIELEKRKEEAPLDETDPEVLEFASILSQLEDLKRGAKILSSLKSMQGSGKTLRKNLEKQSHLTALANEYIKIIHPKKTLECAHMDYQVIEDLKHLPVETAFNIVCLTAYNSLVASGFYEQLLKYTTFDELTPAQAEFFNQLNFGRIRKISTIPGEKSNDDTELTPKKKAFMLYGMRNAICHGKVTFTYPKNRNNYKVMFKDIKLHFNAEYQNMVVVGSLKDFYNLLSSPVFTAERSDEIITTYDYKRMQEAKQRRTNKYKKHRNEVEKRQQEMEARLNNILSGKAGNSNNDDQETGSEPGEE